MFTLKKILICFSLVGIAIIFFFRDIQKRNTADHIRFISPQFQICLSDEKNKSPIKGALVSINWTTIERSIHPSFPIEHSEKKLTGLDGCVTVSSYTSSDFYDQFISISHPFYGESGFTTYEINQKHFIQRGRPREGVSIDEFGNFKIPLISLKDKYIDLHCICKKETSQFTHQCSDPNNRFLSDIQDSQNFFEQLKAATSLQSNDFVPSKKACALYWKKLLTNVYAESKIIPLWIINERK